MLNPSLVLMSPSHNCSPLEGDAQVLIYLCFSSVLKGNKKTRENALCVSHPPASFALWYKKALWAHPKSFPFASPWNLQRNCFLSFILCSKGCGKAISKPSSLWSWLMFWILELRTNWQNFFMYPHKISFVRLSCIPSLLLRSLDDTVTKNLLLLSTYTAVYFFPLRFLTQILISTGGCTCVVCFLVSFLCCLKGV